MTPHRPASASAPVPVRLAWTQVAACATIVTALWLITATIGTWLDNRGQPWLGLALMAYTARPIAFLIASLLAWRGRGRVARTGWILFILLVLETCIHLIHHAIDGTLAG